MKNFISLLVGVLFALGLGYSGMTQPHIVRGFLDVGANWNWTLMGVMIGAIGVHCITFRLIMRRKSPLFSDEFKVPSDKKLDRRLILGALIFGLGWGWTGICPGPGIVSLASGEMPFVYFVISMLIGMKLFLWSDQQILKDIL